MRALLRSRKSAVMASVVVTGLLLTACGSKAKTTTTPTNSGTNTTSAAASNFKGCMVTDTGGIDDKSFNAAAWQGMQAAQSDGKATVSYVQSKAEADYTTNINSLLAQNCGVIVTVGGLMGTATTNAAKANSTQHFIEVDFGGNGTNMKGLQFDTSQAAFEAGYLAAAYSKSGVVATYGGLQIAPVTVYMDGFQQGVEYYNKQKSKSVKVLGWNYKTQKGVFAGSFTDQSKGQQLANNFISQSADVIFPVAGGTGLGSAAVAKSGGKAVIIWVDTDGYVSAPQYGSVFLTTALKNMAKAVQDSVEASSGGTFDAKDFIGTLANDGVGLAPFHDFDSKVDAGTKSELEQIKQDIIAGKITITSPSLPKAGS